MRSGTEFLFVNGSVFDSARFPPPGTVVRVTDEAITAVGPNSHVPSRLPVIGAVGR